MAMFEIRDLSVRAGSRQVIKGFSLSMERGEVHALMGPNGAGKSTLAAALLGHPGMRVSGRILLNGEDISSLPTHERARRGIFLGFQEPQEIEGVSVSNLIRKAQFPSGSRAGANAIERVLEAQKRMEKAAKSLGLPGDFLRRGLNAGFSGGEKKRNEILQLAALEPSVAILDEPDSGLDIDGIKSVSRTLDAMRSGKRCFLLITHYERMLAYFKPDFVHIMNGGKIVKSGDARLAAQLMEKGYAGMLE